MIGLRQIRDGYYNVGKTLRSEVPVTKREQKTDSLKGDKQIQPS